MACCVMCPRATAADAACNSHYPHTCSLLIHSHKFCFFYLQSPHQLHFRFIRDLLLRQRDFVLNSSLYHISKKEKKKKVLFIALYG